MAKIEMTGHMLCATGGRVPVNNTQDNAITLDQFLASVEKRAYRMAIIATNSREDALDIVQDAMLRLAKRYGGREPNTGAR